MPTSLKKLKLFNSSFWTDVDCSKEENKKLIEKIGSLLRTLPRVGRGGADNDKKTPYKNKKKMITLKLD